MKFVELPELVSKDTVYLHNSFKEDVVKSLKDIQTYYKDCSCFCYYLDVEMIKLEETGDVLLFSYRKDGKKLVFVYGDSAHTAVAICDKDIFDFIKEQIINDEDELIIPKMDYVNLKGMDEDFFSTFEKSFICRYCYARY